MTLHAVPKPSPREKTPRKRLQLTKWGVSDKPRPPLAAVNAERAAKRRKTQTKHYNSPEYKAARKVAVARSGGRCEATEVLDRHFRLLAVILPGEPIPASAKLIGRCTAAERLQFHEVAYGSTLGAQRDIDGFLCCAGHHGYIERTRHPTRKNGRRS